MSEIAEVDVSKLDEASRRLLSFLAEHPARQFVSLLMVHRSDGTWSLVGTAPSPTGDQRRNISIWLDEGGIPSLRFGAWHSHADLWDSDPDVGLRAMLDYFQRIIVGEIVFAEIPTSEDGLPERVLDLAEREEVLDELTAPGSSDRMKLLSWSGAEDVTLGELRDGPVRVSRRT